MKNKKTYFLILCLFIITAILIGASLKKDASKPVVNTNNKPTITPYEPNMDQQATNTNNTNKNIEYKKGSGKLDLERFENRKPLSISDEAAKEKLFTRYGKVSNTLYETSLYRIDYIEAPNDFEVEILSTNIELAKSEAEKWFKNQGFSTDGICKLPVSFYISTDVKMKLTNKVIFDPNPNECN